MTKRKKTSITVGDVFTFPIKENLYCYGQIIADVKPNPKLYILFDIASNNILDIQTIIKQPILAITHLEDYAIEEGKWKIIGNAEIALKNIAFPNYLVGFNAIVESYDGRVIRHATERDLKELDYRNTFSPSVFEILAKHKYEGGKWDEFFNDILYNSEKWEETNDNQIDDEDFFQKKDLSIHRKNYEINTLKKNKISNNEQNLIEISIQYGLNNDNFSINRYLSRRYEIEILLDNCLRVSGYGECSGGEIGSGDMFIYCYVNDLEKALKIITMELKKHDLLEGATITY